MSSYAGTTFLGQPKVAGRDNAAHVVEADGDEFNGCIFDANGASEALKSSKHWGVFVFGGTSFGGVEDCHDYVRGGMFAVAMHTFVRGRAKQDVTVKGSFRGVTFDKCPGLRTIEAGNFSKYDAKAIYPDGRVVKASPFRCCRPPVRGGHVIAAPGEPKVTVRLFHSEPWTGDVINKPLVPWSPLHRFCVALYFWFRATFYKEQIPVPDAEFSLQPREL